MMEILFGVTILVLLIWGLANRKKSKKEWIKEERYEESGHWIDKRSGERGTYGSLDEEMEANRQYISLQSKVSELALAIQSKLMDQIPEYQDLPSQALNQHFTLLKSELNAFFSQFKDVLKGNSARNMPDTAENHALVTHLKKQILDFSYLHFPALLALDIEVLKQLDLDCERMCRRMLTLFSGI